MKMPRVDHSVILSHAFIGRNAVVHRAILDKNVIVPDGAQVGVDPEADRSPRLRRLGRRYHGGRQGRHGRRDMNPPASGSGGHEAGKPEGGTFGIDAPMVPVVLGAVAAAR